ncbi:unnamed protein product [Angiostrongylus costaricensis]|uniref:PINc domain-containing protein n=1 Tax=Angiostrongylus costaricensis TaxID=334426 RepID=A0A158PLR5_ANGCS|nr:unnamed protein product [Angiostrongylus costaricensis]
MADGDGQGCSSSATSTTRTRKARPDIQIYRPASPGPFEDCGDSGSTTPDASISNEQHDSPKKLVNSRGFFRSGRFSADKKVCNLNDFNMTASVRKRNTGDYSDRQDSRISSAQKNRQVTGCGISSPNHSYNSTQSLYDPQQSEGYLDFRSSFRRRQGTLNIGKAPSPVRFRRKSQQHTERSSMRAEGGRRNVAHRKRNDSLNSTQSECLAQLPDRSAVDATSETQSVADDAISSSLSYMQLCQSFESLGSFDWSKEVESEYNAKHSEEAGKKQPTESKKTTTLSSEPQKVTDFPVYREISNNQGPIMQKINDSITSLLLRVQKRDIKAAEKVVELSGELCEMYYKLLPRDISFTFTMNLEQHLWKQAFYKPIEVFKSVVNSSKDCTRAFRAALLSLLNNGISFYMRVIDLYEKELHVDLQKLILFSFDQNEAFWDVCHRPNHDSGRKGHALDEIFYCVRALSAGHPFEVARDRLCARLAAMKRKVDKYEPLLDHECGEVKEDAELAASADRPYELWLDNEGSDIETNEEDAHIFRSFLEQQPSKLAALVEQESSPVTAGQLIQIVALFIYAVHCNAIVGDEDVCSVQQQQAVRALVTVFGALLRVISLRREHISTWIKKPLEVPYVISRVLPAVCVLCEWFSCPIASAIYRTMPSVEPLSLSIVEIDTWHLLAEIANELIRWQDSGQLAKIMSSTDTSHSCILPELAFISSFSSVFPPFPRILNYTCPSADSVETKSSGISPPSSREELLERELKKHEQLLVVKPYYVVIDTNAFIDQLCAIQKILQCERFRVLIPTTVVEELIELQHGEQGSSGVEAVTEGARQAMIWLREQTRQKKTSRLFTLTMRGKRLPIAVVRERAGDDGDLVNDDRILHSCLNFTQLEPAPDGTFSNFKVPQGREIPIIYRNLVLLTDDRVLNMKAMSQHIPCRTVTRFMKWAKIP